MLKQPSGRERIALAFLLGILAAFGPLTIDMYLPSFPEIADALHAKTSFVQLSLTACLLGLAAGQLVIGPVSDALGRRRPLIAGILVYVLASLICSAATHISMLIAGRFLQGFAASAGVVLSRAIVRDWFSGRQLTKFFALIMLINSVAPIAAPIVGAGILAFAPWNGVFVTLSLLGMLIALLVFFRLEESLPPHRRSASSVKSMLQSYKILLKDRRFMGFALIQGFMMAGIFSYISGTPFVYQEIYGVSPQVFGILFGVNGLGIMFATHLVGRYAGIVKETVFLQSGLFIAGAAGLLLLIMTLAEGPLYSIVIPMFFYVSSIGLIGTPSFALAMETQAERAGSASAVLGLLPFVLGAAAAPLVGIAGVSAVPMGGIMFSAVIIAIASFYFLASPKAGQKSHARAAQTSEGVNETADA